MTRVTVLGTEIDSTTQNEAVDRAMTAMHERKGAFVITPNAEYLLQAKTQSSPNPPNSESPTGR